MLAVEFEAEASGQKDLITRVRDTRGIAKTRSGLVRRASGPTRRGTPSHFDIPHADLTAASSEANQIDPSRGRSKNPGMIRIMSSTGMTSGSGALQKQA
jgi:hypothetical protein